MRHLLRVWVAYAEIQVLDYVLSTFRRRDLSSYCRDGRMRFLDGLDLNESKTVIVVNSDDLVNIASPPRA